MPAHVVYRKNHSDATNPAKYLIEKDLLLVSDELKNVEKEIKKRLDN
jgi:hypothetical protein